MFVGHALFLALKDFDSTFDASRLAERLRALADMLNALPATKGPKETPARKAGKK